MARYDDTFVDRFLETRNRHDVDGALALMTVDCVWEITRGREPHGTVYTGQTAVRLGDRGGVHPHLISRGTIIPKRGPSR